MKSHLLLALLAALAIAAPPEIRQNSPTPTQETPLPTSGNVAIEIDPSPIGKTILNIIADEGSNSSLERRGKPDGQREALLATEVGAKPVQKGSKQGVFYRGDTRSPSEIFESGFTPQGENKDLRNHLSFGKNSGYVSVSRSRNSAMAYAFGRTGAKQETGYVYRISPQGLPEGYWLPELFPNDPAVRQNQEFAVSGNIPPESIQAAYEVNINDAPGSKGKLTENPKFAFKNSGCSIQKRDICFPMPESDEEPSTEKPETNVPDEKEPGSGEPGNKEVPPNEAKELPKEEVAAAEKELTTVVEEASAKEFAELAVRHKLKSVVETKFKLSLPSFRADKLKYQPLDSGSRPFGKSPSFGKMAMKSAGKSLKVLGAGLYVHDVVTAFMNNVSAVDRAATLTSIVPVVGCATSLAADLSKDKVKALDIVDDALCAVGDVLLFTPLAPLGVAVHVVRFIMGLVAALVDYVSGPSPEILKQVKDARDGPWQIFLQDHMYQSLSSKEFGSRLGSALAVESLAFLSEGAQTIGVFEASQQGALKLTNDATEQGQLRDFFQTATENVRRRLSVEIVDKQRQVLLDLVNNVRDQHKEASLRALADQYSESFIKEKLADADEQIKKYIRDEKPPLPDRFAIAYLVGQSTGQDAELPTLSPSDVEDALASSEEPTKALAPLGVADNVDWEIHPLTLSLTDYLQKKQEGISKEDADAISIQQTQAVMQFLEGTKGEDEIAKASPKLNSSIAQEFQLLLTMKMGRRLRYWKRSEDGKLHFFPESAANDPVGTIASVLGLDGQVVEAALGR